jgi:hypothetical protein
VAVVDVKGAGAESDAFSPVGVEKELFSVDLRVFAGSVKGITLPSIS